MDYVQNEWNVLVRRFTSAWKTKRLSFLTTHYIYLTSMSIIASIMLFPAGGLAYIDALFFAVGAATQSGLNTVNVNQLNTYQQIVLWLIAMLCNPIVIHSTVVFVRLYWFEKRFQHVVREAMSWRQTRTRSRSKTELEDGGQIPDREDQSIRRKKIVLLNDGKALGGAWGSPTAKHANSHTEPLHSSEKDDTPATEEARDQSSEDVQVTPESFHRDITFADEKPRMPQRKDTEQHIAFLENQRNPKDKVALRIPGPRDVERGHVPRAVYTEESQDGAKDDSKQEIEPEENDTPKSPDENDTVRETAERGISLEQDNQRRRNITFERSNETNSRPFDKQRSLTFRRSASHLTNGTEQSDRNRAPGMPRPRRLSTVLRSSSPARTKQSPYLSWQPTIGRNSVFIDLTEEQREELGGIEYRSLKTLAVILVAYFFLWHTIGVIVFVPWILLTEQWGAVVDSDGVNRVWWGIFTPATLFNDLGFTLTPDSFNSFQTALMPMLFGSFLIVIGNTGFPCLLRFMIWLLGKFTHKGSALWEEVRFLLDHPRRCFTLLFPKSATWVLVGILIMLNGIDLLFFIILDLNDPVVTDVNPGYRVADGLFQATSTRTAGTAVVNLSDLHPGIQVSYLIMMYISVFPIAISMRRTNVYEEKSLGVYDPNDDDEEEGGGGRSYIGAHLRRQLSFDLWFIFLGLFIIAIAEGSRIMDVNEPAFTLFPILFEIVSAYGTVGLSLGYPGNDMSFSAEFSTVSKLVILAMMLRGRHRGLPYELDRAILLPSDSMHEHEDDLGLRRNRRPSISSRRQSVASNIDGSRGFASGVEDERRPSLSRTHRSNATLDARGPSPPPSTHSRREFRPTRGLGKLISNFAAIDSPIRADVT